MASLLQTASALLDQLQAAQPLKPEDQQRLDKKFRLEFSYNSNHIEGNTLTYNETKLLLFFGDAPGNHTMRELEEMSAHDAAWHLVQEWAADAEHELSERDIKNLNEIILVKPFWKDAQTPDGQTTKRLIKVGDYKEQPNSVRLQNGEMFDYTSPTDTPIEMGELIAWYRSEEAQDLHPIARAALLHYRFVRIHPFDDGNGRVSRLLMNYALLKNGFPPVIIKTEAKQDYLRALHRADVGELEAFVDYVAEQAIWSLQLSLKAARGESVDEPGDFEKRVAQLKKKQQVPENVEMKYGEEAFEILLNSLMNIMTGWEEAMKQVDTLIYSRQIVLDTSEKTAAARANSATKLLDDYKKNRQKMTTNRVSSFPTQALAFRSIIQLQSAIAGGHLYLKFHENFFELAVNAEIFKRFYYGSENAISKEDSTAIVTQLSNFMLTNLEENLAAK